MTFETLLSDIRWESEKKGRAEGGLSMLGRMLDAGVITAHTASEFAGVDEASFLARLGEIRAREWAGEAG